MKLRYGSAALLLMVITAYFNAVPGAFHYDDFPLLLESPRITSPGFDPLLFLEQYGGRPLTLFLFKLEYFAWGRQPVPYHLLNLVLHTLNVLFLFLLLVRLKAHFLAAFAAAAIFALHPLQAQAVNYIWARSALLMATFTLVSLLLCRVKPGWSILAFQLAIWSRAEALVLALPLALWNRKLRIPALGLAFINLGTILYGLAKAKPVEVAWSHSSPLTYWSWFAWGWLEYLSLMIWPTGFSIHHAPPDPGPLVLLLAWIAMFGFIALSIRLLQVRPEPGIGILWCLLFLTPSLCIPNADLVNDSRAYLALAGIGLAAGGILFGSSRDFLQNGLKDLPTHLSSSHGPGDIRLRIAVLILILLPLLAQTWSWNGIWQSDVQVWQVAVSEAGDNVSYYNLGAALVRDGEVGLAEKQFLRASQLNPGDDMSYAGLGYCAEFRESLTEALALYERALELNPGNDYARMGAERIGLLIPRHKDEP
ncbi:MAG: tetratricopeptide repeat protein [Acidobacteriota bacterium]|nr:MAG: tetratricopeptide repeat protein [Acidobacteriota bacterium]